MKNTKKIVQVSAADAVSGLGSNVVRIIEKDTGQSICFIGMVGKEEMVWFPKPASYEEVEAVFELLHKKKFSRALSKGKTKRAQEIADKNYKKKS